MFRNDKSIFLTYCWPKYSVDLATLFIIDWQTSPSIYVITQYTFWLEYKWLYWSKHKFTVKASYNIIKGFDIKTGNTSQLQHGKKMFSIFKQETTTDKCHVIRILRLTSSNQTVQYIEMLPLWYIYARPMRLLTNSLDSITSDPSTGLRSVRILSLYTYLYVCISISYIIYMSIILI